MVLERKRLLQQQHSQSEKNRPSGTPRDGLLSEPLAAVFPSRQGVWERGPRIHRCGFRAPQLVPLQGGPSRCVLERVPETHAIPGELDQSLAKSVNQK